jgi:hypothetical protein
VSAAAAARNIIVGGEIISEAVIQIESTRLEVSIGCICDHGRGSVSSICGEKDDKRTTDASSSSCCAWIPWRRPLWWFLSAAAANQQRGM